MNNVTLSVRELVCGYQPQQGLFEPLTFDCREGEIIAILGANGQGKTTLLHSLLGILPVLSGEVAHSEHIGFVPQLFTPVFSYNVIDIVIMGRARHIGLFNMPSASDIQIAHETLALLGIADLAGSPFDMLSGGQRQLVLIARALAMQCKILILDEPMAALDLQNQSMVLHLMGKLTAQRKLSLIFTTHDPAHALAVADRALLLMDDKSHLFGAVGSTLTEEHLSRLYHLPVKRAVISDTTPAFHTLVPVYQTYRAKD